MNMYSILDGKSGWSKAILVPMMVLTLLVFSGCKEKNKDPIQTALPSVVSIEATGSGQGSGVIFSKDGYIITNDHVIRGANSLSVHLSDKRVLKAKLVGTDSRMDIAVIKVDENNLQPAKFADSNKVKLGAEAIAIGNPLGLKNSTSKGIISNIDVDVDTGINVRRCLQIDTPINPGNSGGALINMRGEVIGINDLKLTSAESINFAIPGNDAKKTAEQIIEKGYVSWPYLGIDAQNKELSNGNKKLKIILVNHVMKDSPAAKAGLRENDIIFQINDARVEDVAKLREQLNASGVGSMVSVYIYRKTKQGMQEGTIQVKLEELPKGYYTTDWS